jgi:hypothetical protein
MILKQYVIVHKGSLKKYYNARRKASYSNSFYEFTDEKTPWIMQFMMRKKAEDIPNEDCITVRNIPILKYLKFLPIRISLSIEKILGPGYLEIISYSRQSRYYVKTDIDIKIFAKLNIRYEVFFFYSRRLREKMRKRFNPDLDDDFDYKDLEELSVASTNTLVNILRNIPKKVTWFKKIQKKANVLHVFHSVKIDNSLPFIPNFLNFGEIILSWIFKFYIITKETTISRYL